MSSYIGRSVDAISNVEKLDNITFDGSTSYALTKNSTAFVPSSANNILISINGVVQQGNFSVNSSNIVFDSAVSSNDVCNWVLHYGTGLITTPSDGSVTTAKIGADAVNGDKIADDSISDEHLDITAITGQTEKTSLADADKFLISDSAASGALKYVQKSNLPSGGLVHLGSNTISSTVTSSALSHFTTDYEVYLVNGYLSAVTSGADMYIRFRTSSGDNTNNSYQTSITANLQSNGSVATAEDFGGWGLTYIPWVNGVVDSNIGVIRFTFFVYNPMSTNHNTGLTGNAAYYRTNNSWVSANISAYSGDGASTQHTGITFLTSSGGYDLGKINVYGIKNS